MGKRIFDVLVLSHSGMYCRETLGEKRADGRRFQPAKKTKEKKRNWGRKRVRGEKEKGNLK